MTDLCHRGHEREVTNQGRTWCRVCARKRTQEHRDRKQNVVGPSDWRADDVDEVAVDRALRGTPVGRPLHPREQIEIARRIARDGGGLNDLARVLRCGYPAARQLFTEAS